MKPIFSSKKILRSLIFVAMIFVAIASLSTQAFPQRFDISTRLDSDGYMKLTDTDDGSVSFLGHADYQSGLTNTLGQNTPTANHPLLELAIAGNYTYSQPITPGNDQGNFRFWVIKTGSGTLTLDASVPSPDPDRIFRNNRARLEIKEGTVILAMSQIGAQGDDHLFEQIDGVSQGATLQIGGTRIRQIMSNINNMNGTFDLHGFNQEIDSLGSTGNVTTGQVINLADTNTGVTLAQRGGGDYFGSIGVADPSAYPGFEDRVNNITYIKTGGDSTLRSPNYHTGGTQINNGRLNVYAMSALGAGALSFNGGYIGVRGANSQVLTFLAEPSSDAKYTPANSVVFNEINIGPNGAGFNLRDYVYCEIYSKLTGVGGLMLSYESGYALTLFNTDNDYKGNTYIGNTGYMWGDDRSAATLRLGADNVLPDTTNVVFGYYLRNAGAANEMVLPSVLDLNGKSDTVRSLTGTGIIRNLDMGNGGILKMHANPGEFSLLGNITTEGNVTLQKTGLGDMVFDRRTVPMSQPLEILEGNIRTASPYAILPGDTFLIKGNAGLIADTSGIWGHYVLGGGSNRTVGAPTNYLHDISPYVDKHYDNDQNAYWPYETTQVFTSVINIEEDVNLQFFKHFDDRAWVTLTPINPDGTLGAARVVVDGGGNWDVMFNSAVEFFQAGEYLLEIRPGQGGGGVGPRAGYGDLGFGVRRVDVSDPENPVPSVNPNHSWTGYYYLNFDADGNMKIDEGSPIIRAADQTIAGNYIIDGGKTFTVSGLGKSKVHLTGNYTGPGSLTLDGAETDMTFSGRILGLESLDVKNVNFQIDLNALLGDPNAWLEAKSIIADENTVFTLLASDISALLGTELHLFDIDESAGGLSYARLGELLDMSLIEGSGLEYIGGYLRPNDDQDVPEPAAWGMMMLAAGGLLWMRRRTARNRIWHV